MQLHPHHTSMFPVMPKLPDHYPGHIKYLHSQGVPPEKIAHAYNVSELVIAFIVSETDYRWTIEELVSP